MNKNYQNQEIASASVQNGTQGGANNVAAIEEDGGANISSPYADLEESLKEYFGDDFRLDDVQSQKKLKVRVMIFGRKTPLELSFMQVEKGQ